MATESNGNGHYQGAGTGQTIKAKGLSGRRFLILAGITLFLIWGSLFVAFRQWRSRYRERASFGLSQVLPAFDGMASVFPPEGMTTPDAWRDLVNQTRAMLRTVVASNLLDRAQMEALRAELEGRVDRARQHPETALAEVAAIWDEMAARAEFLLTEKDRHPRPRVLPPRKAAPR